MSPRKGQPPLTAQERIRAAEDEVDELLEEILALIPVLTGKRKKVINLRRRIASLTRGGGKAAKRPSPEAPPTEDPTKDAGRGARFKDQHAAQEAAKRAAAQKGVRPWKGPRRGRK